MNLTANNFLLTCWLYLLLEDLIGWSLHICEIFSPRIIYARLFTLEEQVNTLSLWMLSYIVHWSVSKTCCCALSEVLMMTQPVDSTNFLLRITKWQHQCLVLNIKCLTQKTYINAFIGDQDNAFWIKWMSLRKMNQPCFYRYFKGNGLGEFSLIGTFFAFEITGEMCPNQSKFTLIINFHFYSYFNLFTFHLQIQSISYW